MKASKDKLRLMRWSDDGYPPIDLRNENRAVIDLIQEVRRLRGINTDLLKALKKVFEEVNLTDTSMELYKEVEKLIKE